MVEQNSRKMLKESKRGNNSVIFVVIQMDTRQLNMQGSWVIDLDGREKN